MELKKLQETSKSATSTTMISNWQGINKNLRAAEGQFLNMKNMTSDYYPILSPREKRGIVGEFDDCTYFSGTEHLYWVDDYKLYCDTEYVCELTKTEKQLVQMGAYLCVFPDKIAYNTYNHSLIKLEEEFETISPPMLTICKMDGTVYDSDHMWIGKTEPTDREEYNLWLDTSSTPAVLKMYSENEMQWVSIPTVYVKIYSPGIGENFKEDDAVEISGCDIDDFNTTMIIQAKSDDYIVVIGLLEEGTILNSRNMTIKRSVPDMEYVCEYNNRLYGCNSEKHEIYVSKQADPTNWNYFGGLTSDSYTVTVGTDGKFTGAVSFLGYVMFFKERGVHKLYGSSPSTYQMSWTELRGVQEGSERSIVNLNEMLFYKSREGICVYDGSLPVDISREFGTEQYFDATAGKYNNKYYISMRDKGYKWYLYVYDTNTKLWHMEDNLNVSGFANYDGSLYFVDQYQKMWIVLAENMGDDLFPGMSWDENYYYPSENLLPGSNTEGVYEDDVTWEVETADMGIENPYQKYVSKIIIRILLDEEAVFDMKIQYDSNGIWEDLFNLVADGKRSYSIPIRINRCDHFKLFMSGVGKCKLYSLSKVIETGSEVCRI